MPEQVKVLSYKPLKRKYIISSSVIRYLHAHNKKCSQSFLNALDEHIEKWLAKTVRQLEKNEKLTARRDYIDSLLL